MAIDAATRDSLELTRSVSGSRRRQPARRNRPLPDRRRTTPALRRYRRAADRPARDRSAPGARRVAARRRDPPRARAPGAEGDARLRAGAWRGLRQGAEARAISRCFATDLAAAAALQTRAERRSRTGRRCSTTLLPRLGGHDALVDKLARALVASPPIDASKGGYIAEGYDAELDALRDAASNGRRAIAALEARYRDATGVCSLKIRHNAVLGYHVEVSARHADRLMAPDSGFTHRQTLAGVVRFNSPELHEEASRVVEAGAHALAAEAAHAEELTGLAVAAAPQITATAEAIARIDVAASHAHRAAEGGWTAPQLTDEPCLEIEAGRHPVVESRACSDTGERFVANDLSMGPTRPVVADHRPEHGRQIDLPPADRADRSARAGRQLRPRGRARRSGSSTACSAASARPTISRAAARPSWSRWSRPPPSSPRRRRRAWSSSTRSGAAPRPMTASRSPGRWSRRCTTRCKCRTLFATHYHELTRLAGRLDALSLHHVRAREWKGDLVLLHEVADGAADRSYGIAVAKLAGLPPAVVARAKSVLAKLEAGRDATGGIAAGLDDLPLVRRGRRRPSTRPIRSPPRSTRSTPTASPRAKRWSNYIGSSDWQPRAADELPRRRATAGRSSTAARLPTGSADCARARGSPAEATAILRGALEYGRAEIARRLAEQPGNGRAAAQATAFLHDQLVRLAYDFVIERVARAADLAANSRWSASAAPAAARWLRSATST